MGSYTIPLSIKFSEKEISILSQASKLTGLKRASFIRSQAVISAKKILKEEEVSSNG